MDLGKLKSRKDFVALFTKKMWITGKTDQTSQKDLLCQLLSKECKSIAPGAHLSYKLRTMLTKFTKDEQVEIVNRTKDGCAPLFIACQRGNTEVVDYLISVCGAFIEQKGLYEVSDDSSVHHVTPLWCAAVSGKLNVIKCLVKHEANINSVSDTGSTPVRSACFMTHYDIVEYLVEHGTDICKPNINGGTCLINSVQSVKLCEFLIRNGADVNAPDIENKTALHYAIQEHRFKTTALLLKNGAKPFLKSKYNDDALQTACIKGDCEIFEYLIANVSYSPNRIADGFELLGSTFLDEHHDIVVAINYWREAVNIRKINNILKEVRPPSKPYEYRIESSTASELEIVARDLDDIRIQSLLICERILGNDHRDMVFRLMYRGAAYADSCQYQMCINLWLYTFQLRIRNDTMLYHDTCFTGHALVRLYLDMIENFASGQIKVTVTFSDAYETLDLIAKELSRSIKLLQIRPIHKKQQFIFETILKVIAHIIHVLLQIKLTDAELQKVAKLVNKILKLNPRTKQGGFTLLHLSVSKTNMIYLNALLLEERHTTPFPSLEVASFLLHCGADVNVTSSEKGFSPLYIASQKKNFNPKIVLALIQAGAHIDQAALSGETPSSLLSENVNCPVNLSSYISLKCLAARVIRNYNLSYKGEIPVHLEPFVEMH